MTDRLERIEAILANVADRQEQFQADLEATRDLVQANAEAIQFERNETINVEVDNFKSLQELKVGQAELRTNMETLNTYVRRGFDILGQALVELREEMQVGFISMREEMRTGFSGMSELLQKLIDEVKVNSGRITRLEDME